MRSRKGERQLGLLMSLIVAAALAVSPGLAQQAAPPQAAPGTSATPAVPGGGAGMTVYIDPQTGAIRDTPAPGTVPLTLSPREREALSTSHQDLVEVPSTVPGGGFKLDLQGRFQSPLIGTVDGNGKVKVEHLGEKPGSHDEK